MITKEYLLMAIVASLMVVFLTSLARSLLPQFFMKKIFYKK